MADQNKKIQRILVGDKEYEINAKYWGGLETGSKQDTLISGENIKTICDKSILGSGNISLEDLGLARALKYCGVTTTKITDGSKTNPIKIGDKDHNATAGCVVFYEDDTNTKEFVFNGINWELLGSDLTYKVVQNAISSPDADGDATAFIDTITQDANGVITVTKKNVDFKDLENKYNNLAILLNKIMGVDFNEDFNSDFEKNI